MESISAATVSSTTQALNSMDRLSQQSLGKEAFLRLLVAQLQHQDPLNPVDNQAFIGQMAEFSALEQMQNLNEGFQTQLFLDAVSQSAALLGKQVEFADWETGALLSGKVEQVRMVDNEPWLVVASDDQRHEIGLHQIQVILEGE